MERTARIVIPATTAAMKTTGMACGTVQRRRLGMEEVRDECSLTMLA